MSERSESPALSLESLVLKGFVHFFSETGTEGGYWAFQDESHIDTHSGQWSHEGLRILEDGDQIAIYEKGDPTRIAWKGVIKLIPYGVFTQHVYGFWIHADVAGQNRENWASYFFEEYPAELVKTR
jgi:hypothetical protein